MIPRIHGEATVVAIGVYTIMIVTMAVQAVSAYFAAPAGRTKQLWFRSAVGGIAQLISDTLLGFSMFVGPFPAHDFLVMTTYWLAIWLYAASLQPKKQPTHQSRSVRAGLSMSIISHVLRNQNPESVVVSANNYALGPGIEI